MNRHGENFSSSGRRFGALRASVQTGQRCEIINTAAATASEDDHKLDAAGTDVDIRQVGFAPPVREFHVLGLVIDTCSLFRNGDRRAIDWILMHG